VGRKTKRFADIATDQLNVCFGAEPARAIDALIRVGRHLGWFRPAGRALSK
jgi:hypothetical protein